MAGWFLSEFGVTILQAFFFSPLSPLSCHSLHHTSSAQLQAGEAHSSIIRAGQRVCMCASYSIRQHVCNVCQCVCVFSAAEEVTTPCFQSVGETRWRRHSTWPNAHYLLHQRSVLESYTWDVFIHHSAEIAGALLSTVSWLPLRGLGIGMDPALSLFFCLFSFFSLSLYITCQTVCCFVCNLGVWFLLSHFQHGLSARMSSLTQTKASLKELEGLCAATSHQQINQTTH